MVLQFPAVQTRLAGKITDALEEKFDGRLDVGKISIDPLGTIVLKDISLIDNAPMSTSFFPPQDTITHIRSLVARLDLRELLHKTDSEAVRINRLYLNGTVLNFVKEDIYPNGGMDNIKRIFHKPGTAKPMQDLGDLLLIRHLEVRDLHLKFFHSVSGPRSREGCMDFTDMELRGDARGRRFAIKDGTISGILEDAYVSDKSGYAITHCDARVTVRNGEVDISGFHMTDVWSRIDVPELKMTFGDKLDFRSFSDSVALRSTIVNTHLSTQTLGHLVKGLQTVPLELEIRSAEIDGLVNNLTVSSLDLTEQSGISLKGKLSAKGLPDIAGTRFSAIIDRLDLSTGTLQNTLRKVQVPLREDISRYARGESLHFRGVISGVPDDFRVDGKLYGGIGSITTGVCVRGLLGKDSPLVFEGPVSTDELDIGRILGSDSVHGCTMRTSGSVSIGKELSARIDSLSVDHLNLMGYDYTALAANGTFEDNAFNGKVICSDPNLNFIFQGIANLSRQRENAIYKFWFNLGYADLAALHLDTRGTTSRISAAITANYMRIVKGDLIGDIVVQGLMLEDDNGLKDIGDIFISSHSNDNIHRGTFKSSFADASFVGSKPVTSIYRDILAKYEPGSGWEGDRYQIKCDFHDSRDLLSFISPGLYIADGTSMDLDIDEDGDIKAGLSSSRIAIKDKYLKDLNARLKGDRDTLRLGFSSQQGNASTGFTLRKEGNRVSGHTLESRILRHGQVWTLSPSAFGFGKSGFSVDRMVLNSSGQTVTIDGGYSTTQTDTLRVTLSDIDFDRVGTFLGKELPFAGIVSGGALLSSPTKENLGLLVNLTTERCVLSGRDAGTVKVGSAWNEEEKKLDFVLSDEMGGFSPLLARGAYDPAGKALRARIQLDRLNAGYFEDFLTSVFSGMEGGISGEISLAGPLSNLSVFSRDCRIDDGLVRIAYTNVPYRLDGPFHMNDQGIYFDDVAVSDGIRGNGTIDGGIIFDHLHDFSVDAGMRFEDMLAFDLEDGSGYDPFYGKVTASGVLRIQGPFEDLLMDVDAVTSGDGSIHIPLGEAAGSSSTNILTFKNYDVAVVDPYEEMVSKLQKSGKKSGGLALKIRVGVDDGTECLLEIDKATGNVITGRGDGDLSMSVAPSGFKINGDYTLVSGNYHFAVLGIASKDFDIQSGSSIKFDGDIMDSMLDIDALYSTKTSLSNLIADTTSVSTRRLVECGINISDRLRNPKLAFSINVPDLDPSTKSLVESALNTDDKVQKQFLSLLVANSFIPDEQSGIVNNTNLLYSNVASIMAGQLNNILERLDIPLDLGLTYQSNERSGTNIFDVAVSTQLFNNRVVVNGVIGNRQYGQNTSGEEVVGDLDIEVKLNKSGSFRASMFSHSADVYTNYLDNSQRNGLGLAYQKEFNTFREFFRSIFRKKKDRGAILLQEEQEKVVIEIN